MPIFRTTARVTFTIINSEDIDLSTGTTAALQQKERLTSIYGALSSQFDDKAMKEQACNTLVQEY